MLVGCNKGVILLKDDYNFIYKIADIIYNEYDNEDFEYIFYPNYSVIDLLDSKYFQGIPGLDLSLRKKEYIRKNVTPVFISERSPSKNREDLQDLLKECNMNYYNRLEWLKRTKTQYFGDRLYVRERQMEDECLTLIIDSMFNLVNRFDSLNRALLLKICRGESIRSKELELNDSNRKEFYDFLMPIYIKEYNAKKEKILKGVEKAKENNVYKGRKEIEIDEIYLKEIIDKFKKKELTSEEAAQKLNISKSTFFRRLKLKY